MARNTREDSRGSAGRGLVAYGVFQPGDAMHNDRIHVRPSQAHYLGFHVRMLGYAAIWMVALLWVSTRWNVPMGALLVPPAVLALRSVWKCVTLACISYSLEGERIIWRVGVFARETGSLELFRVRNVVMSQSFFQRLAGVGNVTLMTQDQTNPCLHLWGMPQAELLRDWINEYVLRQRRARGFQEFVVN